MTTDPLEEEIQLKRRARDEIRAILEKVEFELATLERAASLRPIRARRAASDHAGDHVSGGKGRQVGAISRKWRAILQRMALLYAGERCRTRLHRLARQPDW